MNTSNIKKYAPVARKQFRDAVIQKLTTLGIEADKKGNLQISQATDLGDNVRYGQFTLEKSLTARRERLVKRAEKQGYEVLVEHIAYTWFNRFCAIRYMELHGYLDHGFRILSHTNPTLEGGFEVLDHVPEVADALGLDKSRLVEMKLAGDRDEELYRELLLAQCHTLQGAMPFLFEAVNDDIELVLPDNLTRTDSILRGLVDTIPEEDWAQVEVIGWLYQFYISEKKDDVIGKVVKSEDIPAATQLFTPNWIVQYLVQNSVGRQWLQTYPDSSLKGKMPYYIEPAEQTPEVQAQLAAITPSSIEPESIKVLDPACGSGHILTEAYNVLKAIYEERGYRTRDIPQLILENNIFGLDIDDRAAQLSGFAMLMLARQDDRRILTRSIRLNIVSLQESKLDIAELWTKLNFHQQVQRGSMGDMFSERAALANTDSAEYKLLMRTLALFTSAKTLGSLIQVPHEDEAALKAFLDGLYRLAVEGDIQQKEAAAELIPYIQQAWILAQHYDAVVANPPYMGGKGMNGELKEFAKKQFPDSKSDLFAIFMQHAFSLLKENGFNAQVNMQSWMFLSSYEALRGWLLDNKNFITMAHLGARGFGQISGEVVQTTAWVINNLRTDSYQPVFFRLIEGNEEQKQNALLARENRFDNTEQNDFKKIPGAPIAYWISDSERNAFSDNKPLVNHAYSSNGIQTGNNDLFVRLWSEISQSKINKKWLPYIKGGSYRKWYGNLEYVVNWCNNGDEIKKLKNSCTRGEAYYLQEGISWSDITSGKLSSRYTPRGCLFDASGPTAFFNTKVELLSTLALLNTNITNEWSKILNPTLHFQSGDFRKLPLSSGFSTEKTARIAQEAIDIHKLDWDSFEVSCDFLINPLLAFAAKRIRGSYDSFLDKWLGITSSAESIEVENIRNLCASYALNKVDNIVFKKDITLKNNIYYRYNIDTIENDINNRFRSETLAELISYSIGCQMGRYSLDREGLVYAHEGNKGFANLVAEGAYKTFPADQDGILPLMDSDSFDDDVTARVKEFVRTVWGEEHLQENLNFIAESLCLYAIKPKKGESSLDTIRRYLSTQFWKDHMKMYKKRPIYWLFSSGKEKAFECLVYLHRYNDATLSRMRTEYVVPLLARYQGNIDLVSDQLKSAESGAATTRLKKELDGLTKKFNELRNFDDRLRHYADMRITIDLDDGVKVNYGKFGDLLADVKAITGSAPEEI
ncbi:BREX-1 system adenine-specific DNA-methyltransferase PglX [Pantoea agglomerans]|uniref:BREX-1 system adenine-specific DNA-methyltransferase PglX n=1 Tax=Enterobacter agglomerans TaxID=549 RepID=UPI0012AE83C1|nr:BREX-1 system adenine-specific DNA-methyltransferase PglX [Pantoea agglomerans]MRT07324.1 BREX-1 system adenine-specific DNA-methyltransferase PglX [Pantoea agglomerans]